MAARTLPRARTRARRSVAPAPAQRRVLDAIDFTILELLQEDARLSLSTLARRVGLSPPGLQKRLRRLEQERVILRYAALVDRAAVDIDLLCFVQVTLARHQPEAVAGFRKAIAAMSEVLECHHVTGDFDYLLKVVVPHHRALESFLVEKLTPVRGIDRIRTGIVLSEVKVSTALPLSGGR